MNYNRLITTLLEDMALERRSRWRRNLLVQEAHAENVHATLLMLLGDDMRIRRGLNAPSYHVTTAAMERIVGWSNNTDLYLEDLRVMSFHTDPSRDKHVVLWPGAYWMWADHFPEFRKKWGLVSRF
jgi:hypothetical protein